MNGRIAKKLRRQAKHETEGTHEKDRIIYYTENGERFLTIDCFRGRYQALKKLYRIAKRTYKKMPKLQIVDEKSKHRSDEGMDMPIMRDFLDISFEP